MDPPSLGSGAATEGLDSPSVEEEICARPDFAESLPLLSEGVKAATAGLSFDFVLLGVTGSDIFVVLIGIIEVDKDEVAVVSLSTLATFVETVAVELHQQD